jgi:hypothetical protein
VPTRLLLFLPMGEALLLTASLSRSLAKQRKRYRAGSSITTSTFLSRNTR